MRTGKLKSWVILAPEFSSPSITHLSHHIDYFGVETAQQSSEVLHAIDHRCVINFVYVILVKQQAIRFRPFSSNQFRGESLGPVELIRQDNSGGSNEERRRHQGKLFCESMMRDLNRSRLRKYASQDGFQKPLETVLSA